MIYLVLTTWPPQHSQLNKLKSAHIILTYGRLEEVPTINLNLKGVVVPYINAAKYLGMMLDVKLKWKEHVKKKHEELDISVS